MPHRFFRTRFLVVAALLGLVTSCGGGAGTGDLDKIQVTTSQFEIAVTNSSGRALFDVRVEVLPAGPASHFVASVARMENGETRSLSHNVFTDRDHVSFSLRNTRVRGIAVTGKDIDGKTLHIEVPFRQ